jgi:hypothetical protein
MFLRVVEVSVGIVTAALGVFLFARIVGATLALGEPLKPTTDLVVFLILALPGIVIAAGAYLHAVRRKAWGFLVIFAGVLGNLFFVVFNPGLNYAVVQDRLGQLAISTDFTVTLFGLVIAVVNTVLSFGFGKRVPQ